MGIWWKPDRMAGRTDPQAAQFARPEEDALERRAEIEGHETSLQAAERSLATHWREQVSCEQFVAALRALADALSQDQNFTLAVDHHFISMRPIGTPSIEYHEIENQRKAVTFRFSWEP